MCHLDQLPEGVVVPLAPDHQGYVGRECPGPNCGRYFKITPGTGLPGGSLLCHCPYCGRKAPHLEFTTDDQTDHAVSIAKNIFLEAVVAQLDGMCDDLNLQSSCLRFGPVVRGEPPSARHYQEKELETEVICETCSHRYAIYGVFGYCPDCGVHNTADILGKSLDVVEKILSMAKVAEKDVMACLIDNALEDAVSAFDAFGRETCRVALVGQSRPLPENLSFQNLASAEKRAGSLQS